MAGDLLSCDVQKKGDQLRPKSPDGAIVGMCGYACFHLDRFLEALLISL